MGTLREYIAAQSIVENVEKMIIKQEQIFSIVSWVEDFINKYAAQQSVYLTALGRGRREGFLVGVLASAIVVFAAIGGR